MAQYGLPKKINFVKSPSVAANYEIVRIARRQSASIYYAPRKLFHSQIIALPAQVPRQKANRMNVASLSLVNFQVVACRNTHFKVRFEFIIITLLVKQ